MRDVFKAEFHLLLHESLYEKIKLMIMFIENANTKSLNMQS